MCFNLDIQGIDIIKVMSESWEMTDVLQKQKERVIVQECENNNNRKK